MLDDSAMDLLNYLQNRILLTMSPDQWVFNMKEKLRQAKQQLCETKNGKYLNTSKFYEESDVKHRWVRLPESIEELKNYHPPPSHQNLDLQLDIRRCDLRYEKRVDKQQRSLAASALIQRCYRGYKARLIARRLRESNASIVL